MGKLLDAKRIYDDVPIEVWQKVLNENMDYSFNLDWVFLPQFADYKTVLDVGCGWGSNIRTLRNMYGTNVTGLTHSEQQAEYLKDEDVILANANEFKTNKKYDCITYIQSITHMRDTSVTNLANATDNFFITDYIVTDRFTPKFNPQWAMKIRTEKEYRDMFKSIDFEIDYFNILPYEAYHKKARLWLNNIYSHNITNGHQINMLQRICEDIIGNMHRLQNILMVDIHARRSLNSN